MVHIKEFILEDGCKSFRVQIRRKGLDISKNFRNIEDANLYADYKERLIDNIKNFEVPLKDRITLNDLLEIKLKDSDNKDLKCHVLVAFNRFNEIFGEHKFYNKITYKDWEDACKKLSESYVFRGAKSENGKRIMSLNTLRRYFAYVSSCVSHAQSLGIELDNIPLKILQVCINPKLKK